MTFQRYFTISCQTSFENTKPQIRRYKHAFRHANVKPLQAKYLTHANASSFPKFTAVYKTTPEAVPRTPWLGYGIQPVSGPLTPCTEGKTPVDAPFRAVKPRIGN